MQKLLALAVGSAACLFAIGCGSSESGPTHEDAPGATSGAGASGAATSGGPGTTSAGTGTGGGGNEGEWVPIITADWQLASGMEKTSDIHSVTIAKDTYVGAIRPIAPIGTHHTVLAVGALGAGNIIYASGVGTNAIVFPKGIGLKLSAGDSLILQLHLFNTSAKELTGTSGIEIIEVAPGDLQSEADLFLPGPMDFAIPPNQKYTATGTCTVAAPQKVFAVFPHMHQLGAHLKSTLTVGGQPNVIHDGDYSFNHQAFIPFDEIALAPGDTVETECTWNNNTAQTVSWGESSTTEMCFSILYRYPAQGGSGFGFCND